MIDSLISISGSLSLELSKSATVEIQRQNKELLDVLTDSKIPQLYPKMVAANISADILWNLNDQLLQDCGMSGVEKLRYERAKNEKRAGK